MNKLGVVHSGYDPIIPLGNRICLRMMLDDYQKGNFWNRKRSDYEKWAGYVYLKKRTYRQQINDIVESDPEEIFLVIDTPVNNFEYITNFIWEIINTLRHYGFYKKIVYSVINECLEHMTVEEVHTLNRHVCTIAGYSKLISFAVGEMACNFTDYYKTYLDCGYEYDYISFHTDNWCEIDKLNKFLKIFPKGTKFINNEHYSYNTSKQLSYDNQLVVNDFKNYTVRLLEDDRIKSVYVCMPYHAKGQGKYPFLGLNQVDLKDGKIYSSVAWKMLKLFDIKGGEIVKLLTLKNGDKNFQVRCLQSCLKEFTDIYLKVDGWFGDKTDRALQDFNKEHHIKNPTVCGLETWWEFLNTVGTSQTVEDLIKILSVT